MLLQWEFPTLLKSNFEKNISVSFSTFCSLGVQYIRINLIAAIS